MTRAINNAARRVMHAGLALCLLMLAAGKLAAEDRETEVPSFAAQVAPLVKKYCFDCHGAAKQEAEIGLHTYADVAAVRKDADTWFRVLQMLKQQSMPPEDARQPSQAERQALTQWLENSLRYDCQQQVDPGRVTIRRLNRSEYNNTIRDLLGVDIQPAKDFPSDDVGDGFDNMGDVLSVSPLLLEKYVAAAERVAAAAIRVNAEQSASRQQQSRGQLRAEGAARLNDYGSFDLVSAGAVVGSFRFPRDGEYLLRAEAGAQQAGDEVAKMELRLDGKPVHVWPVKADRERMEFYEHRLRVKAGNRTVGAAFINDYYNPQARDRRQRDRNLYVGGLEVVGPLDLRAEELPASHRRILVAAPGDGKGVRQAAEEVLRPLVQRAFRRRIEADALTPYVELVLLAVSRGDSFERGVQVALSALLVSPQFLFRVEGDPDPEKPRQVHPLNDYQLASRLSYFLWSSMPDDELFALASGGRLQDPRVLQDQVRRMLRSDKVTALVENFGGQWLNLRNLEETTPDPRRFPDFDDELRSAMRRETELFFAAIIREDRSILDFLQGDFTFVNERLARHYGLSDVRGEQFRRVALETPRRRGVLTHAGILTLTSNPTRTSPVKRGLWIMENVLGTPPPAPPADVPDFAEAQKAAPQASLREQLELHRRDARCAVCHRTMDPLGFGMENFDAVGRWRDADGKFPVDAAGKLPSGEQFQGPAELLQILARRKQEFGRALSEKMLTYALGRGLEFYDRCAVDKIMEDLERQDYRFSTLVTGVVTSVPFRMRRGEGGDE